jgi:uncharacterized protein (DUF1697 family)
MSEFDVVNIGAAGTFVVRKPRSRTEFRDALVKRLPFEVSIALCDGRDILRLERDNPFDPGPPRSDITRFVSILVQAAKAPAKLPIELPAEGDWLVRLIDARDQFVFGEYRRHMKTIGYLGQVDNLFGGKAMTRNWSTILTIVRVLKGEGSAGESSH